MTDEIKEIELDHFNNINELKQTVETWIKEDDMYWNRWFSLYDLKTLLDYITNLQQENEYLKLNNPEMNIEHFRIVKENKRKIDNLRKENKRLKEEIDILKSNFEVEIDDCENYKKWYRDYKSRCEKTIELLKLPIVYETHQENGERDELLKKIRQAENILNGSDEE